MSRPTTPTAGSQPRGPPGRRHAGGRPARPGRGPGRHPSARHAAEAAPG